MFALTEPLEMVQQIIRQYAEKEIRPHIDELEKGILSPFELTRKMMKTMGGGAMLAKPLEKLAAKREKGETVGGLSQVVTGGEQGGAADDPMLMNVFIKELCRVAPGLAMSFGASLGLAGGAIIAKGTGRQIREYAIPLFTQEKIGAWALTEPQAGSDAFGSMQTTAAPADDGAYILNGGKTFITNAPMADTFVVYAKIDRGQEPRNRPVNSFILTRGMKGLTTGEPFVKMGMKDSPTGEVFMEDVRVDKSFLLGEVEMTEGRQATKDSLGNERSAMQSFAWGMIEYCYEQCLALIREEHGRGRNMLEEQGTLLKLYDIYMALKNTESIVFRTAWMQKNNLRDPAYVNAVKAYVSGMSVDATGKAMEIFGDYGYMHRNPISKLFRDSKLLELGAGTTAINIFSAMRSELGI